MKRYKLVPNGTQKSFYGKAIVMVDDAGNETLYSYGTPIITRTATGILSSYGTVGQPRPGNM